MAKKSHQTSKESQRAQGASAGVSPPPLQAPRRLQVELLSDTTFSRGEGTAGVVDAEVEHDEYGMPFIGGKTIRGLLRDAWLSMEQHFAELRDAAKRVFGESQALDDACRLRIGDAVLPDALRAVVQQAVERKAKPITPSAILEAFTSIRYQTAEDRESGAPDPTTLRASRVVLRGFAFESRLLWLDDYRPAEDDVRLLALCVQTVRHGGLLRNRGRGWLRITLDGDQKQTKGLLGALR